MSGFIKNPLIFCQNPLKEATCFLVTHLEIVKLHKINFDQLLSIANHALIVLISLFAALKPLSFVCKSFDSRTHYAIFLSLLMSIPVSL